MSKHTRCLVLEADDEETYEPALGLFFNDGYPKEGILEFTGKKDLVAIFPDRKKAQGAIDRMGHYRLAFGRNDMPQKKQCKIVPAVLIP
jgi:hypothetical protein